MQVVILAAGEGTRMRPLTARRPKPMLPVAGRPMVARVADAAVDAGATDLVFTVGYEADQLRSFFDDEFRGVPVEYAVQSEQRGTADALAAASDHLDETFAVLNGDNWYTADDLESLFEAGPAVACTRVDDPSNYGVLSADGGTITNVLEKPDDPPTDLANAGAYVFPEATLAQLDVPESERGERELTDVLERLLDQHTVQPVQLEEWLDVGRPWELLAANERELSTLDRSIDGEVHPSANVVGDVVVESGAAIGPSTVVEGSTLIESGASVGPNALISGPTVVGADAAVGHAAEVTNSLLMAGTTIGSLSYVADSILGERVDLGAGTAVANRRNDGQPVSFTVKGEAVSTGRPRFGAVLGDEVKTGVNTSLDPGVRIAPDTTVPAGTRVSRER